MTKSSPLPRRSTTIGMWLFLASLTMLFGASMVGYLFIRVVNQQVKFGSIQLPKALWVSTLMMLASSYTIHRALIAIKREKQALFRIYLSSTIVFASIFILIQTPAMVELYHENSVAVAKWHAQQEARQQALSTQPAVAPHPLDEEDDGERIASNRSVPFYALVMALILIHALHVVGGLVALGIVAYHGYRGFYDHEQHAGVTNCVLYWHFLDAVWILMFTLIGAAG
ncbi:MAG: cytochrome c oxidase subunit 3 [Tepidisphaeraceae bacterium]